MPPKKKSNNKPAMNAFFFFMQDIQRKSGGKISLAEAANKAAPLWQNMNKNQRAPWDQMAQTERARYREFGERYNCDGKSFTQQDREEQEKKNKLLRMKNGVRDLVETAIAKETIKEVDFFFIDINIFCVTERGYYSPAELAISRFSFSKGVYDTYHICINPEEIPIGYKSTASINANETHQLPIPPESLGESNIDIVMNGLIDFLMKNNTELPYLFTLPKNMQTIEDCLIQMCDEAKSIPYEFDVFSVAELLMNLMNNYQPVYFENVALALMQFDKDLYDYFPGLGCEYHETTDVAKHCSLSRVRRWAYTLADELCQHMGIDLIPGSHVPGQAATKPALDENEFEKPRKSKKRGMSRAESINSVSTVRTLPRHDSVASTPAPSLASSPPRYNRRFEDDSSSVRSTSPTESLCSSVSGITIESASSANASKFPLSEVGNKWNSGRLAEIRRPLTQAQVLKGTAASLLQCSTTEVSSDDGGWPKIGDTRRRRGAGRGIAAKFSNP